MSTKVCKFYLQGTCRFGNNCKFLHSNSNNNNNTNTPSNNNSFNRFSNPNRFNYLNPDEKLKQKIKQKVGSVESIADIVQNDFKHWLPSKVWPFSCYSVNGIDELFPELKDLSFDEARFALYNAKNSGSVNQHIQEINSEGQRVQNFIDTVCKANKTEILNLIQQKVGAEAENNMSSANQSTTQQATNNVFKSGNLSNPFTGNSPHSSSFGSQSTFPSNNNNGISNNSVFGSANSGGFGSSSNNVFGSSSSGGFGTNSSSNVFGTNSNSSGFGGNSNVFGSKPNPNVFGSNANAGSGFGSNNNNVFKSSSFASQPANNSQNNVFLSAASNPVNNSAFGSSNSGQSAFGSGNTGFGQPSFGQSAFGQSNPLQTSGQSPFNQPNPIGQPVQPNTGSNSSVFGQNPGGNPSSGQSPFGQSATTQPTITAASGFGNPSPFGSASPSVTSQPQATTPNMSNLSTNTAFGGVQTQTQVAPSNPFAGAVPKPPVSITEDLSRIPKMTEEDLVQYRSSSFTCGKIPECPPPPELCV